MTTENALVPVSMTLDETMRLGATLAKSGYFDDAKQAAQAVVKILAGREMGFGPIASMTGISVIKGKVAVGANLMASAVKGDPRYDYQVAELTTERCELVFFKQGAEIGRSVFTIEDARAAGVGSAKPPGKPASMLTMFARNMLFARAMSNGMRWFCPDACGGNSVYTPDELGAGVGEEMIDVSVLTKSTPKAMPTEPVDEYGQPTGDPFLNGGPGHTADIAEAPRESDDLESERKRWPSNVIAAIVTKKLAANTPNAIGMLNLSKVIKPSDELDLILQWATDYRETRKEHDSTNSAAWADEQMAGIETV